MKYLVVTGGSLSGLGKGTCASAMGVVLQARGMKVTTIKIDPYLNVDAGTIAPSEHGEVFVLDDGHEGDLDLGNYERALDINLTGAHNITTGKIYQKVIQAERRGKYLGATVQVVPHVTDCIQQWIKRVAQIDVQPDSELGPGEPDVCIIEVGGTVGDIESSVYLEAISQLFGSLPPEDCILSHLAYVPLLGGEQKSKPSQHSFKALREAGLQPNIILARSSKCLEYQTRAKLALFARVNCETVLSVHDVPSNYHVPALLNSQNAAELIIKHFQLVPRAIRRDIIDIWTTLATKITDVDLPLIKIGIVAKYLSGVDTYLSLVKGLEHAAAASCSRVEIIWIDAEERNEGLALALSEVHGIIIPGGFGSRGFLGKIDAMNYARISKIDRLIDSAICTDLIPMLGICYGLHVMLIEGAINLLHIPDATSEELDATSDAKIICYMPETANRELGGTMRLGGHKTVFVGRDSLAQKLYAGKDEIIERHRHRYEVNPHYVERLKSVGFNFVGTDVSGNRMEIVERSDHPFFLGVQYHPEMNSKITGPNPCLVGIVQASYDKMVSDLASKVQTGNGERSENVIPRNV